METSFETKVSILADLWLNYRWDEDFQDYIQFNDIGLPLAYSVSEGLSTPTEKGIAFVVETWRLLLEALNVVDSGFENLDDLLSAPSVE